MEKKDTKFKKGYSFWKGKKRPFMKNEEYRQKMREAALKSIKEGRNKWYNGGAPSCIDCNKKLKSYVAKRCTKCTGLSLRGINSPNWKGGLVALGLSIRNSWKYRQWRCDVFERDNYTCQHCGIHNGMGKAVILNADHIKTFRSILKENNIKNLLEAENCEQLWNINNGRTLCKECHKKTETYGGKYKKN